MALKNLNVLIVDLPTSETILILLFIFSFKSKEARNEILHLASLELSDEQLKIYVRVMIQVLEDKGDLKNYGQAERAITNLRQV